MSALALAQPDRAVPSAWREERIYFEGDQFFVDMLDAIGHARQSIDLEMYIFEKDVLGDRIAAALCDAARRGVKVRVMVDGFGSSRWYGHYGRSLSEAGVIPRIYHPLPWQLFFFPALKRRKGATFSRALGFVNKRNHRKVCIIDDEIAFAGSMNVAAYHLHETAGERAWRDTSVRVRGDQVSELARAFELAFLSGEKRGLGRLIQWLKKHALPPNPLVRLNITSQMKRILYRDLLLRLRNAHDSVNITTAYFVPRRSLVRALRLASRRGARVRLLVPQRSDVFFLPFLSQAYYGRLLKAGVEIYEYLPRMLHAKTVQIDEWAIVGSTNLNHRSVLHDLEVDLLVTDSSNREALKDQFSRDLTNAALYTLEDWHARPWIRRLLGRLLLYFRGWM